LPRQLAGRSRARLSDNKAVRAIGVTVKFVLLGFGSVLVFLAFDRNSHSVSDTVRPLLITVVPVWIVAAISAVALLRKPKQGRG
jgi:hypothetical protein